jgi:hypothetical protein
MSSILVEWFREVLVNLHQDKAEIHIQYIGGLHKCVAANEGGEIFDQQSIFRFLVHARK